ncbi:MAG: GAF domain-containing protein [bacterium]|nr:GAF domain-containing protein [bacterium]
MRTLRPGGRLLPAILLLILSCAGAADPAAPRAERGVLDLREWDFERDGSLDLEGEWEFYWKRFADDIGPETQPEYRPPAYWNAYNQDEDAPAGEGFGTYRLRILLPETTEPLALLSAETYSASRFRINEIIKEFGSIGKHVIKAPINQQAQIFLVNEKPGRDALLTVEVANDENYWGGIRHAPRFGRTLDLRSELSRARLKDSLLTGAFAAFGIYNILLQFIRKNRAALWFGLIAFLFATRTLVTGSETIYVFAPLLDWNIERRIQHATAYLAVGACSRLLRALFTDECPDWVSNVFVGLGIAFTLSLFFSSQYLTPFSRLFNFVILMFICITIYVPIRAALNQRSAALLFLLGFFILAATVLVDIWFDRFVTQSRATNFSAIGALFFFGMQSFVIASRYNSAFQQVEDLSANLEKKVQDRTARLAQSQAEAERAHQESEILGELSRRITEKTDVPGMMQILERFVFERYRADYLWLLLINEDRELHSTHMSAARPELKSPAIMDFIYKTKLPLEPVSSILTRTIQNNRVFYVSRIPAALLSASAIDSEIVSRLRLRSVAHLPLRAEGRAFGILVLGSTGSLGLGRHDIHQLQAMADQVAGAVHGANLFQQMQAQRDQTERLRRETESLNRLLRRITTMDDIDRIMKAVMEVVVPAFNITNYSLYTFDRDQMLLRMQSMTLPDWLSPEEHKGVREPIDLKDPDGVFASAYRRGRKLTYLPKIIADAGIQQEHFVARALNLSNLLIIPLFVDDELIGYLNFTAYAGQSLSRRQGQQLALLGDQIAGVIRANELRRVVQIEKERSESARRESDRLLLNILPEYVAQELKEKGQVAPVAYESATVMFTDFVGFTKAATAMSPQDLIRELDGCFTHFDQAVKRNGLEKLKTIGDAYMCVGGVPLTNHSHALDACLTALELLAFMDRIAEVKAQLGEEYWSIRIGIHSGPVTAGVVGTEKFAYDIWGDTVNTASRMESASEPGRINLSWSTHALIERFFECEERPARSVKGKGEMTMYFLKGLRASFSADESGFRPSARFLTALKELRAS